MTILISMNNGENFTFDITEENIEDVAKAIKEEKWIVK